jgi:hypothetical protein
MLKVIYAFFVGLLLAVFVGVGVSAFYPSPEPPKHPELLQTYGKDVPPEQNEAQADAQRQYDREYEAYREVSARYNRNVSIAVLIAAILFVSFSLVFARKIQVIADGILLGGIFTLLYSIGRSFEADDTKYTFVVVSIGLVVALFLGYLRFIKPQEESEAKTKSKPAAKKAK